MRSFIAFLLTLFVAAPALAEEIKHTEAGVVYQLPSDWKTKKDGAMVETSTPDDSYHVMFLGFDATQSEAMIKGIDKEFDKLGFKDAKMEAPVEATINGIKMFMIGGTAKIEGTKIECGAIFALPPKGGKALLVIGINAPGSNAKAHDAALELVIKTMQPLTK